MPWHDSWVGIAMLTADQQAEAQHMERETYARPWTPPRKVERSEAVRRRGNRGRRKLNRDGKTD